MADFKKINEQSTDEAFTKSVGMKEAKEAPMDNTETGLPIGDKEVADAIQTLTKYKEGKSNLDQLCIENEEWWKRRHWNYMFSKAKPKTEEQANELARKQFDDDVPQPNSAWLWNSVLNKHADAMDNFPTPVVQPRERSDEDSAKVLGQILPFVLENAHFEETYSLNWWEKLKHGTGIYGIMYDKSLDNGIGDIAITPVDVLNIYFEPGITDIQKSRNVFTLSLVDKDLLNEQYPEYDGQITGNSVDVNKYLYDDTIDTEDKIVVIDWYYKKKDEMGRTILHYAKIAGDKLLFSTENSPSEYPNGWYDHGMYPFVFDTLFPEKCSPIGFGMISVCKDAQMYIDKLGGYILQRSAWTAKPRYFVSESAGINPKEFCDINKTLVTVQGSIDASKVAPVTLPKMDTEAQYFYNAKIDELKETSANRDVNNGGGSSATAAAAISALQEAGNKVSRDMISNSYRVYRDIVAMVVELMRQFYDEKRTYRIILPNNQADYVEFSNDMIGTQSNGMLGGQEMFRTPVFDIKISAQKKNPYNQLTYNEMAKEMYQLGFFNPQMADQTLGALEMMDFEGIDKVKERAMQGQTMMNILNQMAERQQRLEMALAKVTGVDVAMSGGEATEQPQRASSGGGSGVSLGKRNLDAETQGMTTYQKEMVDNAKPDVTKQKGVNV